MTDYEKGAIYFKSFTTAVEIKVDVDFENEEFRRGYNEAHDEYVEAMHGRIEYGE